MIELDIGESCPTHDERLDFINLLGKMRFAAVDTEKDPETLQFLGMSVAFPGMGMYFPVGHMEKDANIEIPTLELLMKTIRDIPLRVFQHAGHDLMEFQELDFPLQDLPFACTMIMAHMIDENVISKSLDHLHKTYTGGVGKIKHPVMEHITSKVGWRFVPVALMNQYGKQDAVATCELFCAVEPLWEKQYGPLY